MKIDTEQEFELAQKYKIRSLPTVVRFTLSSISLCWNTMFIQGD